MDTTLLSVVVDEFPTMIFAINARGEIVNWNNASQDLTGYLSEEIVNDNSSLQKLLPDKSLVQELISIQHSVNDVRKEFHTTELRCKNGEEKKISLQISHRKKAIIEDLHTWVIAFDKTEQFHLSEKLTKAKERFEMISNATTDAIWEWNLDTKTIWWGEGINNLFGHLKADQITTFDWWANKIHPKDRERVVKKLRNSAAKGENTWRDEYCFKREDGTYSNVSDRGLTVFDVNNKAKSIIGGMTDVTEKKIYEQGLIVKNKQLSEYAFFNSHRVRAPLARLLSAVDLLQTEGKLEKEMANIVQVIKTSAENLDLEIKEIGKLLSLDTLTSPHNFGH
jgi:PAS domain S-box-containing protein